jgi:hypothetical protein
MNSLEFDLTLGLVGVFLFILKNPDKKFLYPIAVLALGLFVSQAVFIWIDLFSGKIIWIISALGLLITYPLRFLGKPARGVAEFTKMLGVLLLVAYPIPFYSIIDLPDGHFWSVARMITFYFLAMIYIYDRWILKSEMMNKNKYVVVLISQAVVILLLLTFSLYQKAEAEKQMRLAQEELKKALEQEIKAQQMELKYQKLVDETSQ